LYLGDAKHLQNFKNNNMRLFIHYRRVFIILMFLLPAVIAAQPATKIYLFELTQPDAVMALGKAKLITDHKGYNSQPSFHNSSPLLYYASADDSGRSDIKFYNYETGETKNLTTTMESEYSPSLTPDYKYVSCVIQRPNGHQDLGKYPVNGGAPSVIIDNLVIGYYGWMGPSALLLFVLKGDAQEMHFYDLANKRDSLMPQKPGRCFLKLPGENAMAFVDKTDSMKWMIRKMDFKTHKIEEIAAIQGQHEDFAITKNGIFLMGNGNGLVYFDSKAKEKGWRPILTGDTGLNLQNITRLSINPANNRLAVVLND
jgi:hypothetical protein